MTRWYWIDRSPRTAAAQMAIDLTAAHLAIAEDFALMRWYQWERDTLSFGAHEAARRTWSQDRLTEDAIAVVRRPTGGRGVWHAADDLTYAWCGPVSDRREGATRYREIHQAMADVLRTNGLAAHLNEPAKARVDLTPGACFDLSIGGEVVVDGRKVIGAAQRFLAGGMLQHGAIARTDHRATEARYLLGPTRPARSSQREWPDAITLAHEFAHDERRRCPAPVPQTVIDAIEEAAEAELRHFSDPEWTWRR